MFYYGTAFPRSFWNWPGWFPLPGFEEGFHDNACIMDAGQNYITLPGGGGWGGSSGGGCEWSQPTSIKIHASNNKVYVPDGDVMVAGCSGPPPRLINNTNSTGMRPLKSHSNGVGSGCQLYNDTDCSGGFDLSNEPMGKVTETAAACMDECAKNCACAIGVWGKTAQGTHKCYLKSKGPQLGKRGGYKGNVAFTCNPTCAPPKPAPPHHGGSTSIKFAEWAKLGVDPGSSVAELPSTAKIIEMGMEVLNQT